MRGHLGFQGDPLRASGNAQEPSSTRGHVDRSQKWPPLHPAPFFLSNSGGSRGPGARQASPTSRGRCSESGHSREETFRLSSDGGPWGQQGWLRSSRLWSEGRRSQEQEPSANAAKSSPGSGQGLCKGPEAGPARQVGAGTHQKSRREKLGAGGLQAVGCSSSPDHCHSSWVGAGELDARLPGHGGGHGGAPASASFPPEPQQLPAPAPLGVHSPFSRAQLQTQSKGCAGVRRPGGHTGALAPGGGRGGGGCCSRCLH